MKKMTVVQDKDQEKIELSIQDGETILAALLREEIHITAPCGGNGTCGKCKVQILTSGKVKEVQVDKEVQVTQDTRDIQDEQKAQELQVEETGQGEKKIQKVQEVLACRTLAQAGMVIRIPVAQNQESEHEFEVLSQFIPLDAKLEERQSEHLTKCKSETQHSEQLTQCKKKTYGIAIDLGTTSVVVQLIRLPEQDVMQSIQGMNPQRKLGADVLSRITAANTGKLRMLREMICMDLWEKIQQLLQNADLEIQNIQQIVISGNTTMLHLLRGYSVEGLGRYPFEPVTLKEEHLTIGEVFFGNTGDRKQSQVTLLPGISAFVGADIVAGLYALDFMRDTKVKMLVDLGTNGELAIGNSRRIITTSTAAGPAFEGGNLSCGVGSMKGAINTVQINRRRVCYKTIGNQPPVGLCGTGAVEALAELVTNQRVDQSGLLREEERESGFVITSGKVQSTDGIIRLTQEDIRQLQLAKAAIRAGIEILLENYGVQYEEIDTLYLAGGMGFSLDIKKATIIGLIPTELEKKVVIAGNTCLGGTVKYLSDEQAQISLNKLIQITESINLADQEGFQDRFLTYIDFQSQ